MRHSPLDAAHRAAGARMAEFGGWDMPLSYEGVLEEHRACRERAVVFDVSHLGSLRVNGAGAFAALQWALTNDLDRIGPGRAQYTHLLDPDDAHVVDDLIVWWLEPGDFLVMPNASNTEPLVDALRDAAERHGGGEAFVEDVTADRAVLAVQGPAARELLAPLLPDAAAVERFHVAPVVYPDGGVPGWAAGTGYTGEDGVELHVPRAAAARTWAALRDAGIAPAGLGARDTLRLEAGLPLHGHELGPGITPVDAGLGWVVRPGKGDFRGREAFERAVSTRRLRGLSVDGRQIPRAGCDVLRDGASVGTVTSGNFSPTLGHGIALAFLALEVALDEAVTIDVRGRAVPATVTRIPFVRR
ncbi:MAG TPA: glycine cleavage system aminomethyltransferase GcvT [Acidimicrobiia bacterium]